MDISSTKKCYICEKYADFTIVCPEDNETYCFPCHNRYGKCEQRTKARGENYAKM